MAKPNLTDALTKASGRDTRKQAPPAAPPPEQPNARAGLKVIAGHFDAAISKQLRALAVERDSTVQALLAEAIGDLFEKYGRPRLA